MQVYIDKPGIYKDVPIEDYHASAGISNSGLNLLLNCPQKYWYQYLSGQYVKEKSLDLLLGSVVHARLLEPETFWDNFHIMPKLDKRKTADKLLYAEYMAQAMTHNKQEITETMLAQADAMVASIKCSAVWRRLKDCRIEVSFCWRDEGVLLRTRPDLYSEEHKLIIDIKTTVNASPSAFSNSIYKFGYHRQAALACDGVTALTDEDYSSMLFIAVEKTPPYVVGCYVLGARSLDIGRVEYKQGIEIYKECLSENQWPSYTEITDNINVPEWVLNKYNL